MRAEISLPITCQERERYLTSDLTVGSSLTDPMGDYGEPRIETEWWKNGQPFLLDILECEPIDIMTGEYKITKCSHYRLYRGDE